MLTLAKSMAALFVLAATSVAQSGPGKDWSHHTGKVPFVIGYDAGLAQAKESGKPLMLFLTTTWCGWCKKLAADSFSDEAVAKELEAFVPVIVDGDVERDVIARFDIGGYPDVRFVTVDGQQLGHVGGYVPKAEFRAAIAAALRKAPASSLPAIHADPEAAKGLAVGQALDGAVGRGHRRAVVLGLEVDALPEVPQGDRPRRVRERLGEAIGARVVARAEQHDLLRAGAERVAQPIVDVAMPHHDEGREAEELVGALHETARAVRCQRCALARPEEVLRPRVVHDALARGPQPLRRALERGRLRRAARLGGEHPIERIPIARRSRASIVGVQVAPRLRVVVVEADGDERQPALVRGAAGRGEQRHAHGHPAHAQRVAGAGQGPRRADETNRPKRKGGKP